MQTNIFTLILIFVLGGTAFFRADAQSLSDIKPWEQVAAERVRTQTINHSRSFAAEGDTLPFNASLAPFYHGVASGDPLTDRVIIWTRVTPTVEADVVVTWQIAADPQMTNMVQTGTFTTNADRDYTVKVDVAGLSAGTTYYYNFSALNATSITGRTRTAPQGQNGHLRFGVVSCSNYQHGYFNAYGRLADRADLDAVIHLGDYIYEYAAGTDFADATRLNEPANEIVSLSDYRTRHSLYKLDNDLRRAHQQHPFIAVWDDHEVANDAWQNGAQNHNPDQGEGDYAARKQNAIQAYFEWMPIRDPEPGQPRRVYRSFHYGDLADLIMLDTRHEGREEQLAQTDPNTNDPNRTLLGATQYAWFEQQLAGSTARWRLIGNQVVMPPINTLGLIVNTDAWDGYPAERAKIAHFIDSLQIRNIAILTGDIHVAIADDVALDPNNNYNPDTGEGAFAVEMVTHSITSANDEALPDLLPPDQLESLALSLNPHAKYLNIVDHGYVLLDVTPQQVQGDWYNVESKLYPTPNETFGAGLYCADQTTHLVSTPTPTPTLPNPPDPAPEFIEVGIDSPAASPLSSSGLLFIAAYPNPADAEVHLHYALSKMQTVMATLHDASGRQLMVLDSKTQAAGIYTLKFETAKLPAGVYFCHISAGKSEPIVRKILVTHAH